jgi:serine/threonine-protein kinase
MTATIPKKIGKYDVLDVIGKGGMGIVYRAKDPFLDRMVAIKIMTISYADYPDLLQRFYREAKATANLQHPNIVTVYELGEHEGSPYIAMQYLEGASLEAILRAHKELPLLQKLDIVIQACHGLAFAHQRGIVHRDIKPGNIMVLKDGGVKIVDFGIARIGDTSFTRTGQFMGSLNYMSLEQLNDKLQVDGRTDVYSTGVVLYQILTGALPFEAESTGATLMKILNDTPPPFSKYISSYPPELETITMKALAKDRDHRYASAEELALDLTQLLDRLKQEAISAHMQQAEALLVQNDLFQANEKLLEVLKLDKQHTRAATMLRTLRKQIEKEQSAERARQLREQAEEAFRREDFDPALGYLDQAISLDTTNSDLQELRSQVQAAKAEIEHLRQVMQRAENAHRAGNLDTAKQAIEEVLSRRPNDTRVKSLYRMIQKELEERMRQKRLEGLLEAARKEMANRRYTAAFDLLKEAEKVDPEAPALRSLLETFTAAREQEQRRRALEQVTRQAEQALNTDDHQSALNLLAEGLKRFPGEPALLKLKDLAETQKQAAQMKAYVRERIAAAREILNAGNAAGALKVLQDALNKAPGNPHLESLVSIAQERLTQDRNEEARARCVHQANEALGRRAYDEAIQVLEAGQLRFAASAEIDSLLRFAREQREKEAKRKDVESSVRRAQEFLRNQEYDRAIALLESILSRSPDEELGIVLEEARRRRDDFNRQIEAAIARGQQFLQEGSPAKAIEFLQAQPASFRRSDQFSELLLMASEQSRMREVELAQAAELEIEAPEPAKTMIWDVAPPEIEEPVAPRVPTRRITEPEPLPEPPVAAPGLLQRFTKQQKLLAAAAVSVVLFIVLVIAIWPSAKAGTLSVSTNVDGAEIFVDGRSKGTVSTGTPLRIKLNEGRHTVRVEKEGYEPASQTVDIANGKEIPLSMVSNPIPAQPTVIGTGTLSIQTNVDAVDVFIDSDAKRTTKGRQLQVTVPAGDHSIRISKDNYGQVPAKQVHVSKDQITPVIFSDLKELTVRPGFLEISSAPGASVSVDGQSWGTIPQDGKARVQVEPKSSFVLEITSHDTEPWKKTVGPVREGQTLQVVGNLTRIIRSSAEIVLFQPDHDSVPAGGSVHLSWKINHATAAYIDPGVGSVDPNGGSKDVTVNTNTTYRLTAKGEDGADKTKETRVSATVVAIPPKVPVVTSFGANPSSIKQGDSTTLTWSANDAQSVTIDGVGSNLPASGSRQVSPTQSTTYRLTAIGSGGTASSSTAVNVEKAPPPPPPPPTDQTAKDIKDALGRLSDAYSTEDVKQVAAVWPSMSGKVKDQLKGLFNQVRAFKVTYESCDAPLASGDTATIECTKKVSYNAGGGFTSQPPVRVRVSLKKSSSGAWQIENETGK